MVLTKKRKKKSGVVAVMVGEKKKKKQLFGRYEDAGRIYRAACGQEIHRETEELGARRVAAGEVLGSNLQAT